MDMCEGCITREELLLFRNELLADIQDLLTKQVAPPTQQTKGYKTKDVREILGCSYNTLMAMKRARKVRATKVLGTWYFNIEDVHKLIKTEKS